MHTCNNDIHLDFNYILSLDALFTLLVGERGVGKTYGFKRWAISDFLKNGNQFVYARRYETELDKITQFFDDVCNDKKFLDYTFSVRDGKFFINNEVMGYYMTLTKAQQYKSTPYDLADKILLDEYIIEDTTHHYLKDEINIFYGLCETIFRLRDFRAFIFGNSKNMLNPYNIHFGLTDIPYKKNFTRNKALDAVFVYSQNKAYQDFKSNTRFGRAVAGTKYGSFANANIFTDSDNAMVERKTNCFYFCTFCIDDKTMLHFFMDKKYEKMYCSSKDFEQVFLKKYSVFPESIGSDVFVTKNINTNYHLKNIKIMLQNGLLYYDDITAKRYMQKIYKVFI